MNEIFILGSSRTPLGSFQGALASIPAFRLGGAAVQGALAQAGVQPSSVTDVLLGNVLQAGQGQAPARQAAIAAGLPASVRAVTIHKVCGSGMQAVMQAAQALSTGDAELVVAGGMENMSAAPYLLPKARTGYRLGHQQIIDSLIHDGLWDPYNDLHMGNCAEACAERFGFTRENQDAYATASFERANAAQTKGAFAEEITPVETADGKGRTSRIEQDEAPSRVNYEKIPALRPAFDKNGTITAANASGISDGAAALVLTSAETAGARGLHPVARVVSFGSHAQDPLWFTTAPVQAARHALARAGWNIDQVDLWEINEAFAVVPLAFMRELNLRHERVNVRGGAISLGHPIGASGARVIVTLLAALRERALKRGVAAICIGGGEGMAVCLELL